MRLKAYQMAIERYVTSRDRVVDVGTGTGILAFLAAARGPRKLYALDHSKKMVKYARAAAKANGIDSVTFITSASQKFFPVEPIDVIIQEQMGIALFDEGMVKTILDIRDRCLKPGGRILPSKFALYIEPVQLTKQARIPFMQEQRPCGLKFPRPPEPSSQAYYFREVEPGDVEALLCDPQPIFAFDLSTLRPEDIPKRLSMRKPIVRCGQVDGLCIYFEVCFDDDISFSTGPGARKTHWPMLFYRTPANPYRVGDNVDLQAEFGDLVDYFSWKIAIRKRTWEKRDQTLHDKADRENRTMP